MAQRPPLPTPSSGAASSTSSGGTASKCTNHPNSISHITAECRGPSDNKKPMPEHKTVTPSRRSIGYQGNSCSYCFSNPRSQKNAYTHSTERCKLDPNDPKSNSNCLSCDTAFAHAANVARTNSDAIMQTLNTNLSNLNTNLSAVRGTDHSTI